MEPELISGILQGQNIVQSVDTENRIIEFIISSETVIEGRGYRVLQDWDLSHFKKNPVFLWMHDAHGYSISGGMPVGRVLVDSVRQLTINSTNEGKVKATAIKVQFPTADVSELGDQIYKLYAAGYLNAVSVNFRPYKISEPKKDGEVREYSQNRLYELSAVSIGADDEAFMVKRAQSLNRDVSEAKQMFNELQVIQSKIPAFKQEDVSAELQGEFLDCGEHSVLVRCNDDVAMREFKGEMQKRSGWYDDNRAAMMQANKVMVAFFKQHAETQPDDLEQAYVRMGELMEQGATNTSDQNTISTAPETQVSQSHTKPVRVTLSAFAMQAGLADIQEQVTAAGLEASRQGISKERVKIMSDELYKQLAGEFFSQFRNS
jgi:hypothetical protein